jgi:hypothetical protein
VAEEKFHGIIVALKVGVKLRYHKTDEFPQITLQHAQTVERFMEWKVK